MSRTAIGASICSASPPAVYRLPDDISCPQPRGFLACLALGIRFTSACRKAAPSRCAAHVPHELAVRDHGRIRVMNRQRLAGRSSRASCQQHTCQHARDVQHAGTHHNCPRSRMPPQIPSIRHAKRCPANSAQCTGWVRSDQSHRLPIHSRCSRSALASARSIGRVPPRQRLRDDLALPSGVFGPVDRCHGFQR